MKLKNILAGAILLILTSNLYADKSNGLTPQYKNQLQELVIKSGKKIREKGIEFGDMGFIICHSTVKGFVIAKASMSGMPSEIALINQASEALTVAYCQDLESEDDMNYAIAQMANSQISRSLVDIYNDPPTVLISLGAVRQYFRENPL